MNFISETLQTEVKGNYDVIVCGGGPSGTCAAIAAGRQGAKVLLVERMNCLGGMWTSGFVNPLFDQENKGGLIREIVCRLTEKGAWGGFRHISFHYEYMKSILENMCYEAGVTVLYNTTFARALTEGNRTVGIIIENVEGRGAYYGKTVVDCTGDAYVAASAGAAYDMGDETGDCQAMTLMFMLANIPDRYNNAEGVVLADLLNAAYDKQGKGGVSPFARPVLIPIPNSRFACVQLTHMYHKNAIKADKVSEALAEGRRQTLDVFEVLKGYDPDFAETDLVFSAPMLGVRESRRIRGEYTLTVDDLIRGAKFDDAIAFSSFNIDIHHPTDTEQTCVIVPRYEIPYRCLIPKGKEGLLVAGRSISGTHEAMASYRVTGDCAQMGEAAGVAAALSALQGFPVREVPYVQLRRRITL